MSASIPENRLRLVGFPEPPATPPRSRSAVTLTPPVRLSGRAINTPDAEQRQAVARANLDAARLSALDARWVLAVQAERALEGGQAAIIPPEARARLLVLAERVGLRPFDANLVIAVVQDAARSGEDPLGPLATDRLRLVREGDASPLYAPKTGGHRWLLAGLVVIVLAGGLAFAMSRWLVS